MKNSEQPIHPKSILDEVNIGLTKREYFAGLALQGLLASMTESNWNTEEKTLAEFSVRLADALLKQLEA